MSASVRGPAQEHFRGRRFLHQWGFWKEGRRPANLRSFSMAYYKTRWSSAGKESLLSTETAVDEVLEKVVGQTLLFSIHLVAAIQFSRVPRLLCCRCSTKPNVFKGGSEVVTSMASLTGWPTAVTVYL